MIVDLLLLTSNHISDTVGGSHMKTHQSGASPTACNRISQKATAENV